MVKCFLILLIGVFNFSYAQNIFGEKLITNDINYDLINISKQPDSVKNKYNLETTSFTLSEVNSHHFCQGASFYIDVIFNGNFLPENNISFYLSDETGSFENQLLLNSSKTATFVDRYLIKLPETLPPSNAYLVRALSSSPLLVSSNLNIYVNSTVFNVSITPSGMVSSCINSSVNFTSSTNSISSVWLNYDSRDAINVNTYATQNGDVRLLAQNVNGCWSLSAPTTISNYSVDYPSLTLSPSTVTPGQTVTATVTGCLSSSTISGTWTYADQSASGTFNTNTFVMNPIKTVGYSVKCTTASQSCVSNTFSKSIYIGETCDNTSEPNGTTATSTTILGTSHLSYHCFSTSSDIDWYKLSINGVYYYIKCSLWSGESASPYYLSINRSGNVLTIETKSFFGSYVDTVLDLYASDGTTILAHNDDNSNSYWSLISYTNSAFACQDNVAISQAVVTGNDTQIATKTITATNELKNISRTNYTAGNSITLNPSFVANNGTVFTAQIGGCL